MHLTKSLKYFLFKIALKSLICIYFTTTNAVEYKFSSYTFAHKDIGTQNIGTQKIHLNNYLLYIFKIIRSLLLRINGLLLNFRAYYKEFELEENIIHRKVLFFKLIFLRCKKKRKKTHGYNC